jgi:hypothetical protein
MSLPITRELPADRYHGGVRAVALGLWLVAIVAVYAVLRWLAGLVLGEVAGLGVLLLIVLAVAAAQPLAYLGERQLVQRWPSGKALRLEPGAIVWREQAATTRFDLVQPVSYWRWRFEVKRRRGGRVPAGHHLFALRLVQGEAEVSVYTFLSPAAAEALTARTSFYELRRPADSARAGLGGREQVYLAAEEARWAAGAELDPADFEALLEHLAGQAPEFGHAPASTLNA